MASELQVDELKGVTADGDITITDGSATMKLQDGIAKLYGHLDTDAVLDASYNTSSATDESTGTFSLAPTNNFSSAEYMVSGSVVGATMNAYACNITSSGSAKTASKVLYRTVNYHDSYATTDMHKMQIVVHGDLA